MTTSNKKGISRRKFLGQANCAAIGSTTLFSSLLNLAMSNRVAASVPASEYRALVCVLLGGGNDSYNMLSPLESAEYNAYKSIRGDLALDSSTADLTPLPISDQGGRAFGIHPGMPEVRDLYNSGDLAFLANTGTLVRPTTLSMYNNGTDLPLALFSHSDQISHWQTSVPDRRLNAGSEIGKGWGGRTADLLHSLNDSNQVSMNISVSGHNIFQTGQQIVPYGISDSGGLILDGHGGSSDIDIARTSAIASQLDLMYSNLFEKTFVNNSKSSLDAALYYQSVIDANPISVDMSDSNLEKDLKIVARSIKAASTLGHKRQTFFISAGGWDHHDNTIGNQAGMLPMVSKAVKKFRDAMVEIGMMDKVTLFQTSDFGRTLTTNSQGSDHAWGGNYLVMGGGVNGGDVYGDYPDFTNLAPIDTGRGRLIPSTSVDEYVSELIQWFGVPASELETVLPNIGNFPNGSQARPIGFLA